MVLLSPCPFMNRIEKGESRRCNITNFKGTNTAGVWQRVTVPANARLTFSAWGMAWSSNQSRTGLHRPHKCKYAGGD